MSTSSGARAARPVAAGEHPQVDRRHPGREPGVVERGPTVNRVDHPPARTREPRRREEQLGLVVGIRDADQYLLHAPLTAGAEWTAVQNLVVQHFAVTSVDATVKTRAGTFANCVVVRNESPLPQNAGKFVTEWSYAPSVGLVQVRTQTISPRGTQEQSRLDLVSYRVQ